MNEHDHDHDHGAHDHDHAGHDHAGHGHDHALTISEEPLDPASQSLSDALRASFRVLKVIMLVVLVLFLLSGVFSVGPNEKVVVWRLGKYVDAYGPGLHLALPYPFDEKLRLQTSTQRMQIDTFWLNLSPADKARPVSDLEPRGGRLEPATDGALLTGDRGIVHLQFTALYEIVKPKDFVQNVSNINDLLLSVLDNAAVATAGASTTDELLRGKGDVGNHIKNRAQDSLDQIASGIRLVNVTVDKLHYPLQTKQAFTSVSTAENAKRDAIQMALSDQTKQLNGVAGPAWTKLDAQIRRFSQVKTDADRAEVFNEINRVLVEDAQGEAGGKIKLAQSRKQEIVAHAEAEKARFEAILNQPEYQRNPQLVWQQQRQAVVTRVLAEKGVSKWFLPPGAKQLIIWLNKDPVQAKEAEIEALKAQSGNQ